MTWAGMSNTKGVTIDGIEHLRQSVRDILTTPIGSRVMQRDYGSALPDLIDGNVSSITLAQFYAAAADAVRRWEPRLSVSKIEVVELGDGTITIELTAQYLPDGRQITIEGIVL